MKQYAAIVAGPLAAACIWLFTDLNPEQPAATLMAGVTAWMAIWWLTEAVHLAVTALLPFALLPLLGIADSKTVAFQYMDQVIFLFIGGFLLAFALERHGLHKRIALGILSKVGGSPARILAGIMFTTWLLSMWISNTAAVMMTLAAVVSVILIIQEQVSDADSKRIATACLIGLSYAATIGGMATLVGTPPNMVFYRFYTEAFPARNDINFIRWFQIAFPISLLLLITCFFMLKAIILKKVKAQTLDKKNFVQLKLELGERSRDQNVVLSIFLMTILLWFTRSDIQLDSFTLKGWSGLFPTAEFIQDSTVAIVMSLLLFLIPSKAEKNTALLTWSEAGRLPFDIILLFGSGFALAKGFEVSGLSAWLAGTLGFLKNVPVWFVILSVTAMVCIISEFASNVASIQLVLPILLSLQAVLKTDPLVLMIPATLAASLGFMLPVATAPNTIVFGTGKIRVKEMLKTGFWMNLAGVMIISLLAYLFL